MNLLIYCRQLPHSPPWPALVLVAVLLAPSTTIRAQDGITSAFEARLVAPEISSQQSSKGTVHGFVVGDELKLIVAYRRASSSIGAPHSSNLYQGDPLAGGTLIQNLALALSETGGLETSVLLTPELRAALDAGQLFVQVRAENITPAESISGRLLTAPLADYFETRLTGFAQGYPIGRGGLRAFVANGDLRIVGYFNALSSNWTRVTLLRDVSGSEGGGSGGTGSSSARPSSEGFAWIWNTGESGLYAGLDQVVSQEGADWFSDLSSGRISVIVETSRTTDALRGRFRSHDNEAPPASRVLQPSHGSIVVIGGEAGESPLDPDLYLGTVTLDKVDDPDGNDVGYYWQVSTRPGFSNDLYLSTIDLGVDSTVVPLSMADGAELFDRATANEPGGIPLQTPVAVFHRVITTDGSRYTVGPVTQTTFVRGTLTGIDNPLGGDMLRLVGNYPNPFSTTTEVAVEMSTAADVKLDVFDTIGRRVLQLEAGTLSAGMRQTIPVDGSGLPAGVYLYRITVGGTGESQVVTGSMIVSR